MATALRTPEAPATKRQLWMLHILTKEDTRGLTLTMAEASQRIGDLRNKHGKDTNHKSNGRNWLAILTEADQAAQKAYDNYRKEHYKTPAFAVVEHVNMSDDTSPIEKVCGVMYDVCGFVWLELKLKGNEDFIRAFKAHGKPRDNSHWDWGKFNLSHSKNPGVWSYPWILNAPNVGGGNGAFGAAKASGNAFLEVMDKHGVNIAMRSRID